MYIMRWCAASHLINKCLVFFYHWICVWVFLYGTNVSEWTDDLNYIKYWQNVHKPLHVKPNWPVLTRYSLHYCDVIMGAVTSQITSLTIVYSTVYSDADQRKHQSSVSLAFVRGIRQGPVNSPGTGEFPAQIASNVENVFLWWRHHESTPWWNILY